MHIVLFNTNMKRANLYDVSVNQSAQLISLPLLFNCINTQTFFLEKHLLVFCIPILTTYYTSLTVNPVA